MGVDIISVVAGAAGHRVGAGAADKEVVAARAVQGVVAALAAQDVDAVIAGDRVGAVRAGEVEGVGGGEVHRLQKLDMGIVGKHIAHAGRDPVIALAGLLVDRIRRIVDIEGVVARAADHQIGAGAADQEVVAAKARKRVVAALAPQDVDAVIAEHGVGDVARGQVHRLGRGEILRVQPLDVGVAAKRNADPGREPVVALVRRTR